MNNKKPNTTLKDVAKLVGMHQTTVSRALSPLTSHLVNEETVKMIKEAAKSLNFEPNPIASSLRTKKSMNIGVVIPDLRNPLFTEIVRGVQDTLDSAGYSCFIVNTDGDINKEVKLIKSMKARRVDGLILATARQQSNDLEQILGDLPAVSINRTSANTHLPSVTTDEDHGTKLAVTHLFSKGHIEIAHLAGPTWSSTGLERANAFQREVKAVGLDFDEKSIEYCEAWTVEAGQKGAKFLLNKNKNITAIFAANDLLAMGLYDELAERKLKCPKDISVVGYNDIPFVDRITPALTTIRIPKYEIGSEASRLILSMLIEKSTNSTRHIRLTPELKVRHSTSGPRTLISV
jgi:LacI family transcriptional regulator